MALVLLKAWFLIWEKKLTLYITYRLIHLKFNDNFCYYIIEQKRNRITTKGGHGSIEYIFFFNQVKQENLVIFILENKHLKILIAFFL